MNNKYIEMALEEAKTAFSTNDVPVGVVIVKNNTVVAKAHNYRENNNVLNHAELIAIKKATDYLGDWRLNDCEMYVTLEPCPMCAGAIMLSRIKKVYIGTKSNIKSNQKIMETIFNNNEYYHSVSFEYLDNIECSKILSSFFANKR